MSAATRHDTAETPIDQQIRRDIAEAIYEQRMAPGTRLSETGLGDIYGVSRTVVRKALFHLAADKLVDIRPNRGAVVWQPSPAEAHEVFAARRLLESTLLADTLAGLDSTGHARLVERLQTCLNDDRAAHAAHDRQAMIRASGDFHRRLAEPAGNSVLLEFLDELIGRSSLIIALFETREAGPCAEADHERLLAIIERGDIGEAQAELAAHLEDCEERLNLSAAETASPSLSDLLGRTRRA
ncbi:GntR family transcriptional regulator [uncultured Salinisphaera sp.]|uniref:GntR family transcriptional regulator n=1 Tax=uncultured Salinisphaera sp. TaxID=359372 RepID=UPI0032B17E7F|tara:strand:+ start:46130 stop:46852 length:723 start_codon:yes stop_codon:yes gene_type:complete